MKGIEESYTTDDFDDVSISNSGSKKFEFASGKMKPSAKRIEDSLKSDTSGISASASKSLGGL